MAVGRIEPRDLPLGCDETCAADLRAVIEGRGLGRADASWLARAVSGAIRPSRDRPLWDLAHAAAALGRDGPGLIDLMLDPALAAPSALRERVEGLGARADARGLVLSHPRPWRCSWAGLARLTALAEFMLTADELARFEALAAAFGALDGPAGAPDLARRLAAMAAEHRRAHMPLAPIERRFGAIRAFLRGLGRGDAFGDDDVVAFWRSEAGGDVLFATVVDHFVTFERAAAELGALASLSGADALEAPGDWESRLEAATLPVACGPDLAAALAALSAMTDGPKLLTKAELEALGAVLALDPFHATRPLTALRARVFGQVQSGIANRLRRGGGGAELAERARCAEASYAAQAEGVAGLGAHLRRCLTIALALRSNGAGGEVAERGEGELRRMRRAGFDAPRARLAAVIGAVDGALAAAAEALEAHREALDRLAAAEPLERRLERDRAVFAEAFAALYLGRPEARMRGAPS